MPVIILTAFSLFFATCDNDQITVLFELLTFPVKHALVVGISLTTGLALTVIAKTSQAQWRWYDWPQFLLPTTILQFRVFENTLSSWLFQVCVLAMVCGGAWLLHRLSEMRSPKIAVGIGALTVFIWFGLFLAIESSPLDVPRHFGAFALSLVFLGLVATALQLAIRFAPIGLVVLGGIGIALALNDQPHVIPQRDLTNYESEEANNSNVRQTLSLQETFNVWLTSRNDLEAYRTQEKPYPVFLVASEGGAEAMQLLIPCCFSANSNSVAQISRNTYLRLRAYRVALLATRCFRPHCLRTSTQPTNLAARERLTPRRILKCWPPTIFHPL